MKQFTSLKTIVEEHRGGVKEVSKDMENKEGEKLTRFMFIIATVKRKIEIRMDKAGSGSFK